jgi:hypothetical protein
MYGYDHPDDPIGPEPSRESPDQRAAWYEAFTALGPADGPDVRALADGRLWLIRGTYTAETAWAPPHTGKELRQARIGVTDASLSAIRANAEAGAARKAGDQARAAWQEKLAASYLALRDHYQQREQLFAEALADRRLWEQATAGTRHLAIAADAELRRRHPGQRIEPLRSAEPALSSDTGLQQLQLTPDQKTGGTAAWTRDPIAQRQAFRDELARRQMLKVPGNDLDRVGLAEAWAPWKTPGQDAILQPPKPQITPSAKILQLVADHDTEPEAVG